MKREQRYGIKSLQKDFPTEAKVLEFLFDAQHSRECSCGGSYSLKSGRRQFQKERFWILLSSLLSASAPQRIAF